MKGASGQWARAASSRLRVPLALTPKSVCGSLAAQSWEGWAAVWMTSSIWPACSAKIRSIASRVADVGVLPAELGVLGDQPLGDVRGRGLGAEEAGPHVVLDADDVEALGDEVLDGLGADQAPGARDDRNRHRAYSLSPAGVSMFERRGDPLGVGRYPLVDVGKHLLGAAPRAPLVEAEDLRAVGKVDGDVALRGSRRPARSAPRCRSARGRSRSSPAARGCTRGRRRR